MSRVLLLRSSLTVARPSRANRTSSKLDDPSNRVAYNVIGKAMVMEYGIKSPSLHAIGSRAIARRGA